MDGHVHHTTVKLEDMTHAVQVHPDVARNNALSLTHHVGSMSDDMSDEPSSPESATFDDSDLLTTAGTYLFTFDKGCFCVLP